MKTLTITRATALATANALREYQDALVPSEGALPFHAAAETLATNLEWLIERFAWTTNGHQIGVNLDALEIQTAALALRDAIREARRAGTNNLTTLLDAGADLAELI